MRGAGLLVAMMLALTVAGCGRDTRPVPPQQRFHMTQDGERQTAEDFDAWLQERRMNVVEPASPRR